MGRQSVLGENQTICTYYSRKVTNQEHQNTQTFQVCYNVLSAQSKQVIADAEVTPTQH